MGFNFQSQAKVEYSEIFENLLESSTKVLNTNMARVKELRGNIALYTVMVNQSEFRLGNKVNLEGEVLNLAGLSHRCIYTNIPNGEEIKHKLDELYPEDTSYTESLDTVLEEMGIGTTSSICGDLVTYFGKLPEDVSNRLKFTRCIKSRGIITTCPKELIEDPIVIGIHTMDMDSKFNKCPIGGMDRKRIDDEVMSIGHTWALEIHSVMDKVYNYLCK